MYNCLFYMKLNLCILQPASPFGLPPEPCPPDNLQTAVQCHNDMAIVTWEASVGAVGYEALLAGRDGHGLSCYTNNTFCNIEGLHCGITYYANIIAVGETLNSSTSNTILLLSGTIMGSEYNAVKLVLSFYIPLLN